MKRLTCVCVAAILAHAVTLTWAQSVYPTGTTIYAPDLAWNGYTVLSPLATPAVLVIDMNGNVVKRWEGYNNSAGGPARVFPGGIVVAASGGRPPHQESLELIQRDFEGKVVWQFSKNEQIETARAQRSGRRASTTTGSERVIPPATSRPRARQPSKAATR